MADQQIKGLPEGTRWTGDFFPAQADDYELMNVGGSDPPYIAKGIRAGAASAVKVLPLEGYTFVPIGREPFDIKTYAAGREKFAVAKLLGGMVGDKFVAAPKSSTVTVKFTVDNELTASEMEKAITGLSEMPGYVSHERSDT